MLARVPIAGADPILSLTAAYAADARSSKINLGVGAYRDEAGKPWLLPSVREATERVHREMMHSKEATPGAPPAPPANYEYVPILGTRAYRDTVQQFLFKHRTMKTSSELASGSAILTAQGLSGTGSLRLACEFMARLLGVPTLYVPNPTWANHTQIARNAGLGVEKYTYYNPRNMGLDIDGLLADLARIPPGSAVLLHVCCHNPTGVDPTMEQWTRIVDAVVARNLVPLLDMAYQGFGAGLEEDLRVLELFSQRVKGGTLPFYLLAQSWAKNMGLYGERVGSLFVVGGSERELEAAESQLAVLARSMYSSPPGNGARIVHTVLSNPELCTQWAEDVDTMAARLRDMRAALFGELEALSCRGPGSGATGWEHLLEQRGMFCFTGLTGVQVERLLAMGVYLTGNGRVSVAGINEGNVGTLARALAESMA